MAKLVFDSPETSRRLAFDDAIEPEVMPDGFVPPADISKLESFLRGGGQGLSLGFGDELTGAVESLFTDKTYEQSRNEAREANRLAREANPKTFIAGDVAGSILPVVASGGEGLLARGAAKLAPTTIRGMMALGAAQGAGYSEAEDIPGMLRDMGVSSVLAGGVGTAAKGLGALGKTLRADELADIAQTRGAKALGTPKRMWSDPKLAEQAKRDAQLMLDNDVIKWNSSFADMADDVTKLKADTGKAIGDYLESVDMRGKFFDVNKAVRDLETLRPRGANGKVLTRGAYADINRTIDNAVETVKAHGSKSLDFQTANEVKGVLQDLANWNSNKNATLLDKKVAGTFRQAVR